MNPLATATMFDTCPKCSYARRESDRAPPTECPACGLQFQKYLAHQERLQSRGVVSPPRSASSGAAVAGGVFGWLFSSLTYVEERVDPVEFAFRALALLGLAVWGIYFISLDHEAIHGGSVAIGESYLHSVNLVFHEAGHVLFRPFGRFMTVLGGSAFQVIMPLLLAGAFIFKYHNTFGGAVGLWWAGQSMMDVAPYIYDAKVAKLILLGGMTGADAPGSHDWKYILAITGKTHQAAGIATFVDALGAIVLLGALGWGTYLLVRQFGRLERRY